MIHIGEGSSLGDEPDSFSSRYRPGYESAAERIVELIGSGEYRAGDRLPTEAELARHLGVGRSIVRDALKMLSALGLVRVRRGSGIYVERDGNVLDVGAVEPHQVEELFEFRLTVEPMVAALAAERLTMAAARALSAALEKNRAGAEQGDLILFGEGDQEIHMGIAQATGNSFMVATVRQTISLQGWVVKLVTNNRWGSLHSAVLEHQALVDALEAGDAEGARKAMVTHIETTRANYRAEVRRRLLDATE